MALYTSLTGLNGANNDLSVIANNIANVGSTGFKKSRADFSDIFASSASSDPHKTVGIGTIFNGTRQNFTQGPLQSTGNTLDLAITGGGFFVARDTRGEQTLTRNGSFVLDPQRYIADSSGARVMAYRHDRYRRGRARVARRGRARQPHRTHCRGSKRQPSSARRPRTTPRQRRAAPSSSARRRTTNNTRSASISPSNGWVSRTSRSRAWRTSSSD